MKSAVLMIICLGFIGCDSYRLNHQAVPSHIALATPARETIATIARVQAQEKYVVLNFGAATIPSLGTELLVFREGKRVGRVQTTEPNYPPYATANILEGEMKVGDTLRREQPKAKEETDTQKTVAAPKNSVVPASSRKKSAASPPPQPTDGAASKPKKGAPKADDQPRSSPPQTQ